jgi:hypothetical protein
MHAENLCEINAIGLKLFVTFAQMTILDVEMILNRAERDKCLLFNRVHNTAATVVDDTVACSHPTGLKTVDVRPIEPKLCRLPR